VGSRVQLGGTETTRNEKVHAKDLEFRDSIDSQCSGAGLQGVSLTLSGAIGKTAPCSANDLDSMSTGSSEPP